MVQFTLPMSVQHFPYDDIEIYFNLNTGVSILNGTVKEKLKISQLVEISESKIAFKLRHIRQSRPRKETALFLLMNRNHIDKKISFKKTTKKTFIVRNVLYLTVLQCEESIALLVMRNHSPMRMSRYWAKRK